MICLASGKSNQSVSFSELFVIYFQLYSLCVCGGGLFSTPLLSRCVSLDVNLLTEPWLSYRIAVRIYGMMNMKVLLKLNMKTVLLLLLLLLLDC